MKKNYKGDTLAIKEGISYELYNLDKKDTIIFLHGWGSNKEIMKVFKDDFKEYKLLFIDMPGFGKSETEEVWTTYKYAQKIDNFLESLNIDKFCIVGHSFGGKVATLLNPKYLILLSSAGIVEKKPLKVKLKIKLYKLLKPFGIAKIKKLFVSDDVKGMSENMYQTFKNVVDEDFREEFRKCTSKSLVFGGSEDKAVSPNSNKIISNLLDAPYIMLSGEHYFFTNTKNKKTISKKIKKLIKE
jgi:pimeloyl-ACP methyl ester carboxylesterase